MVWAALRSWCACITVWWYQLVGKGGCERSGGEDLMQSLNIRVAHICLEKQAESPTQTSLCATEAQRLGVTASKTRSRTWRRTVSALTQTLKLEKVSEVFLGPLSGYFYFKERNAFVFFVQDVARFSLSKPDFTASPRFVLHWRFYL